ncbi:MAG: nitronate monooxygenase [Propionibacteriaceae bacterium]|jgi:enoyl-[acyl-carrier protein] reductase II|nr:nitronate monooxygenase [Propionibacteriaceae bacterium]
MRQDLCQLLGIRAPIIAGGMTLVSTPELVAAVSNAGGLGVFATGDKAQEGGPERVEAELRRLKTLTDQPFGVNIPIHSPVAGALVDIVCAEGATLVTTGAGNPAPYLPQLHAAGLKVAPVVPSPEIAAKMEAAGADLVIAEGMESGGFIGKITTLVLVPQVASAVTIPVVAAGGFADGRGLAAAFALGACGVQLGTRFMASRECQLPDVYKQAILAQRSADAIVEGAVLPGLLSHRSIRTPAAEAVIAYEHTPGATPEGFRELFDAARLEVTGHLDKAVLGMGQVAGLIHEELSCQDIIDTIMRECQEVLGDLAPLGAQ